MPNQLRAGEGAVSRAELKAGPTTLWRSAPAWRRLTISACCLIGATAAAPYILTKPAVVISAAAQNANAADAPDAKPNTIGCGLRPGRLSPDGAGQVVDYLTIGQTLQTIARNEQFFHATSSPAYASYRRLYVRRADNPNGGPVVVAVPPTQTVHPGDFVQWQGAFTETNLPCDFAPPIVTTVSGTAN